MLKVENLPCIGEKMGSFRGDGAKAMLKEIIDLINVQEKRWTITKKGAIRILT